MISTPRYIDRATSDYIKGQIESGNAVRTKRALQEISSLYRKGYRFIQDQLIGIENGIIGLTFSSNDAKVRRWALNSLAQLGRWQTCEQAIRHALQTYHTDAEVLAAAIATLFRLCRTAAKELRKMGFDEQTVCLAALQHVPAAKLARSCLPLRVENADPELIKLGLIVVGLDRAPPNLFEPNYDNAAMVRVVGKHHDPIVSQYAVWAVAENANLGLADLDPDLLKEVEQLPPNVRAWVFQLLAADVANAAVHSEYLRLGIDDDSAEARLGLANGLKESFAPSYVEPVLEWFTREMDGEIREQILDHLIRHADQSEAYRRHALDAFERGNDNARGRMLAAAAGSALYSNFSAIKYSGGSDLLKGGITMTNNTNNFNISGGVQGGAVAFGGKADNAGTSNNVYNVQTLQIIQDRLSDAAREISGSTVDIAARKEALAVIEDAKKEPTKDKLAKAVTSMEHVESLAVKALGTGTALAGIAHLVAQAAGISG